MNSKYQHKKNMSQVTITEVSEVRNTLGEPIGKSVRFLAGQIPMSMGLTKFKTLYFHVSGDKI